MERTSIQFLNDWIAAENRKPLVIRGARQVGKTWLVRHFAALKNRRLIEINFEKKPQLASLFISNDPKEILLNLGAAVGISCESSTCLLFLDEIQAAPEVLAKLRWFFEDLPELPVIAAGSLLEFVLDKHSFSMPVGRISYMHLEPFSFEEFLMANDKKELVHYLQKYQLGVVIPLALHEEFLKFFKEYTLIGGMPEAIASWRTKRSLQEISQIHHDLIATYRDDMAKYSGRIDTQRIDEVLMSVPQSLGEKFTYTKVNPSVQSSTIKQSLELLYKARVCHYVFGCSANGVPLAAAIKEKHVKVIFLDVGLCSALLGLSLDKISLIQELILINKGGIAEQVVGQILRTITPYYKEPALYYWRREEKGSNAGIDYVVEHNSRVIPIEVKAGSTGALKSLHLFMNLKSLSLAVRVNSDLPTKTDVKVYDHERKLICYTLISIPFYLLGELHRILDDHE